MAAGGRRLERARATSNGSVEPLELKNINETKAS